MAALAAAIVAARLFASAPALAAHHDALSYHDGAAWRTFWRSDDPPARWDAPDSALLRTLRWRLAVRGLEWSSLRLACAAPVWRARLILVRIDPREVRLSLQMDLTPADMRPAWTIDRAPEDAILAVNAGQFAGAMPWGWVVTDGRQRLRPGYGPLSSAVAIDAAGRVRWSHGDSLLDPTGVVAGFQSYPTLLAGDGTVPPALRGPGKGVSRSHRDIRLALGQTRDTKLLIAMTRFDAAGGVADAMPLGPTTPEMAAIMGALGATDAVMLDGGISAQLLLRDAALKKTLAWRGIRKVPLALIGRPREPVPDTRSAP